MRPGLSAPLHVGVIGIGIQSPLGSSVDAHIGGLARGETALHRPRLTMDPEHIPWPVGEIVNDSITKGAIKYVALAVAAGEEALHRACLTGPEIDLLVVGTALGPRTSADWILGGAPPTGPTIDDENSLVLGTQAVASGLKIRGPRITISTACSSGAATIALGWACIRAGQALNALCIGVDELWAGSVLSMGAIGALSPRPCRPYDKATGTSLGEGAGAVILTRLAPSSVPCDEAVASILGQLTGVGQSTDAYHSSRPDPTGEGPFLAVDRALRAANLNGPLALVSGHGTGTRANDRVEAKVAGLLRTHQQLNDGPPTVSSKGLYGHTFGGAGSLEFIELLLALRGDASIAHLPQLGGEVSAPSRIVGASGLTNSYGMGGMNVALVVDTHTTPALSSSDEIPPVQGKPDVVLAGIAHLQDGWVQSARLRSSSNGIESTRWDSPSDVVAEQARFRRDRPYYRDCITWSTITLVANMLACTSLDALRHRTEMALIVSTQRGPAARWSQVSQALSEGTELGSDLLPYLGRHQVASAVSEYFGFRGPSGVLTIGSKDDTSAIFTAVAMIRAHCASVVIAVEVDEKSSAQTTNIPSLDRCSARGCVLVDHRLFQGEVEDLVTLPDDFNFDEIPEMLRLVG